VFPTTSTHQYNVTIAPENTLQYSETKLNDIISNYTDHASLTEYSRPKEILDGLQEVAMAYSNRTWQEYGAMECLTAYDNRFPSRVGNVILVMPRNDSANIYGSFPVDIMSGGATSWLDCPQFGSLIGIQELRSRGCDPINPTAKHRKAGNWTFNGKTVQRCLVEERIADCTIQFSSTILYTVIICNALKAVAMLATFLRSIPTSTSAPLITVGDAVQSFLVDPDQYTTGICYADRDLLTPKPRRKTLQVATINAWNIGQPRPRVWKTQRARTRWSRTISARRWGAAVTPALATMVIAAILITHGAQLLRDTTGEGIKLVWERGFGQLYTETIVFGAYSITEPSLIQAVLLANTPQLLLSFLYLMYNSLFTGMVMGQEWNRFGSTIGRKYLRVTYPQGEQRETYWLQLPYRYALPLMACSAFIHWSTSQSLFFSQLTVDGFSAPVVGYSILATVVSLGFGGLLLVVVFLFGLRRYQNDMPTVGSCSAAISAACHPAGSLTRSQREELVLKPLQWGDVGVGEGRFRHLTFSDKEVGVPIEWETYAGVAIQETNIHGSRQG